MTTVVQLLGALDPGGAEMRALETMRSRQRPSERHIFVTLSGRKGSLAPAFEALGCQVVTRRLSASFPLWFGAFLRRTAATHVHSHVQLASGYLLVVAWLCGVRRRIAHIHTIADGRPDSASRAVYRAIGRLLLRLVATDVVAVSMSAAEPLQHGLFRLTEVKVVYSHFDASRFTPRSDTPAGGARLVSIGRLDEGKNPERAIEVVDRLRRRVAPDVPVSLSLVGRGTEEVRRRLCGRIRALGLEGTVRLCGESADIPGVLAEHDVLLSTTRREGLPGALIEATAAGIPAVVSAIPPNDEVARWLASVVTVPLDADDDVWCDVIIDTLAARADRFGPRAVRDGFDASPFAVVDDLKLDELWG